MISADHRISFLRKVLDSKNKSDYIISAKIERDD